MQLGKPGAEVTKKLLGLHGKCWKPQLGKVFGARKIFLEFLPRNNKLSQVTVHLFLGPIQAAVSYFHKSYKPKGLPNERTLVIIHFSTWDIIGCWSNRAMVLCMQAAWTPHKKKVDATEVTKAPMHSVLESSRKTAGYIRSHKIKLQALKFRDYGEII